MALHRSSVSQLGTGAVHCGKTGPPKQPASGYRAATLLNTGSIVGSLGTGNVFVNGTAAGGPGVLINGTVNADVGNVTIFGDAGTVSDTSFVPGVGNNIGSTEDHEYHRRIWAAGHHGIYHSALRVGAVVTDERLAKSYHRKWHFGHGRHIARMRLPDMESSRLRVLGIPAHLLRQAAADLRQGMASLARRDEVCAFDRELRLWFAAGFIRERLVKQGAPQ